MTPLKRIAGVAALGGTMLIGAGLSAPPAQAAYIVTLMQAGSDVVATGGGTIDTAGLSFDGDNAVDEGGVNPSKGAISIGPVSSTPIDIYIGFTGPTSFGRGDLTFADSGSGDMVGIGGLGGGLFVPAGYVSGSPLADSSTYANQSFSSLGVTPGSYV